MTLSLRGRLLIGVISLVAVGLLVSDIATYLTLQSSLVTRIDEQLVKGSTVNAARTALANYPACRGRGPGDVHHDLASRSLRHVRSRHRRPWATGRVPGRGRAQQLI